MVGSEKDETILNEEDALAQAKEDGIEFVDYFTIKDDPEYREFATEEEALQEADGGTVLQNRRQKTSNEIEEK